MQIMRHIPDILMKPVFFHHKIANFVISKIQEYFLTFVEFLKVPSININVILMNSANVVTPVFLKIKVF